MHLFTDAITEIQLTSKFGWIILAVMTTLVRLVYGYELKAVPSLSGGTGSNAHYTLTIAAKNGSNLSLWILHGRHLDIQNENNSISNLSNTLYPS